MRRPASSPGSVRFVGKMKGRGGEGGGKREWIKIASVGGRAGSVRGTRAFVLLRFVVFCFTLFCFACRFDSFRVVLLCVVFIRFCSVLLCVHFVSFHFVSFRFVSFRFVSFRFVSFRFVSFFSSFVSSRLTPLHFVAFRYTIRSNRTCTIHPHFWFRSSYRPEYLSNAFRFASDCFVSSPSLPFRFVSLGFHVVSFNVIIVSFHLIPFRFVLFRFIAFPFLLFRFFPTVRAHHACLPYRFRFLYRPEYLSAGTTIVLREGRTRGFGKVISVH